jgi:hypothetical protein
MAVATQLQPGYSMKTPALIVTRLVRVVCGICDYAIRMSGKQRDCERSLRSRPDDLPGERPLRASTAPAVPMALVLKRVLAAHLSPCPWVELTATGVSRSESCVLGAADAIGSFRVWRGMRPHTRCVSRPVVRPPDALASGARTSHPSRARAHHAASTTAVRAARPPIPRLGGGRPNRPIQRVRTGAAGLGRKHNHLIPTASQSSTDRPSRRDRTARNGPISTETARNGRKRAETARIRTRSQPGLRRFRRRCTSDRSNHEDRCNTRRTPARASIAQLNPASGVPPSGPGSDWPHSMPHPGDCGTLPTDFWVLSGPESC